MLNDEALYKQMKYLQNAIGAVPAPFDCYMVSRGLKTLALRMRQHQENGIKLARALENNPRIVKLIYPGLESHPQHELYKRQMKGFGGMISLYIKGDLATTVKFLKSLKVTISCYLISYMKRNEVLKLIFFVFSCSP
jgi:cystathionine gamma-lyase